MDPLSIIASALTVSTAISYSLHQLQALYSADHEFQAIVKEVSDIRLVYTSLGESIEERYAQSQLSPNRLQGLSTLLESSKTTLTALDSLIKGRLIRTKTPDGEPKVVRLAWIRQKNKVKALLEELKSTRTSISALWGAAHSSDLSRIQSQLEIVQKLHGKCNDLFIQQSEYFESFSEQVCKQRLLVTSNPSDSPEEPSASNVDSNLAMTGQCNVNAEEHYEIIPRHSDDEQSRSRLQSYTAARMRASRYRESQCEGWCSCSCHLVNHFQTPRSTEIAFGSISIGFSSFPLQRQQCSERNCRKQSIPTMKMTYHFPHWLLARMICFAISLTYMNGPQVSLHMPRVVESNADVFTFAVQGNISGLKNLFKSGLASPFDVAASNGRTALHYAVNYNHQEMSQFLIDLGADPLLEDKEQATTVSLAWGRMFGRLARNSTIDAWRCLFDDEEHLESRAFPPLHKIVLGLVSMDLKQQLELSTANIDDKDADGRTAISWAATRGDLRSVSVLLQYGADPNASSLRGQTPLHWASQNPTRDGSRILQALIDSAASVNAVDYWNRTALIYASCNQDDPEIPKVLVTAGARLDFQDCHQRTSLGYAAKMGKFKGVEYLLSAGADASVCDSWGYAPLFEAVQHNHHTSLQALVQHRAIPTIRDKNGSTVLHIAALYGDPRTMNILEQFDLPKLDLAKLDKNGMSAQDFFNSRQDVGVELRRAFYRLTLGSDGCMTACSGPQLPDADWAEECVEGTELEKFVDALEHLDVEE